MKEIPYRCYTLLYLVTNILGSDQVRVLAEFRRCTYNEHNLHTAGNEIKLLPDPMPGQTFSLNPYGIYPRRRC